MQKFLVIQTAFIGDVVLATGLIEKLHATFPDAQIDFLVRKGNEALLKDHPFLHDILVWDKKDGKLRNLWKIGRRIRRNHYDKVINVQRFAATGLLTTFSGARQTIGFNKNPLSRFFSIAIPHIVSTADQPLHEVERNQRLIEDFAPGAPGRPRLYPTPSDFEKVAPYKTQGPYITISPASVWFTKQYPAEKWIAFLRRLPAGYNVYILGAPSDKDLGEKIRIGSDTADKAVPPDAFGPSGRKITNLAGQLSFLQSAALMRDAVMNYVNDSAPMHFASALNAPATAIYCSTIPAFGFGPLSDNRHIVEVQDLLECRPCGLHGYKACPLGHFHCAYHIKEDQLLETLPDSR